MVVDAAPVPATRWQARFGRAPLQELREDVFPCASRTLGSRRQRCALVAGWLALVVLSVLRQTGVSPLDSVWAEDGSIFLQEAIAWPLSERLFSTYAGYLHLLPRGIAELVTVVPVSRAATALTLAAAGATALCAVGVFLATAGHVRSAALRVVLAGAVVLQPIAGAEALNSIALLQWHLTFAAIWFALWRPAERWASAAQATVLALAVLSSPVALTVVPIVLLRVALLRAPREVALLGATLAAAAVQLTALATAPPVPPMTDAAPPGLASVLVLGEVFGLRVAAPVLLGITLANRVLSVVGPLILALAATLAVSVPVAWAILSSRSQRRATAVLLAGALTGIFGLTVYVRGVGEPLRIAAYVGSQAGSRYVLVPALLVLSLLVLALDQRPPPRWERRWAVLTAGCIAWLTTLAIIDFPARNDRSTAPRWSGQVNQAVEDCRTRTALATLDGAPNTDGSFSIRIACFELPP